MTRKTRSFRPSPALVIGCMALFLAMTGSALAIGKNTVRSAQIVNGQVKTVDLGRDAVRSGKIANETITADDLGTDSVASDEIARDAVDSDEIADNAVSSPEVAPESLTAADLGPNSVGSSEVTNESLTSADLGPNSVRASELGTTTVRTRSEPIAAGAIGSISVACQAGEQVLSGGGQPGHYGVETTGTRPNGNGWTYLAKNQNGSDSTITVYALCLG
jgi:hypothetical protein